MQELLVNTIVEWAGASTPRYDRVLALDKSLALVVVIDVTNIDNDDAVNPRTLSFDVLEEALRTSKASIVEKDPYLEKLHPKILLTDQEKRDVKEIWEIIQPIILHDDVFNPKIRAELVGSAVRSSGRDPKMVRRYLRRYWRGGQTQEALLPRYSHCGTGRTRESAKHYQKLGRRGESLGVNMDAVAEEHFRTGIKLYYENEKGRSLRYAYQKTIETYFRKGRYEKHGVKVPQLPPSDEVPFLRSVPLLLPQKSGCCGCSARPRWTTCL